MEFSRMSGISIVGSGRYLPGNPYTNQDLARVMDTSDEWIRQRTGIEQRHFCPNGQGASDLAVPAAQLALESAGRKVEDLDYIIFSTMTPDHILPGSGPLLGAKLGCPGIPALDIRTQCAAMIYSLQLADALLKTDGIESILVVGSEAHAGFMPWQDWDVLDGRGTSSAADFERATKHRGFAVIFGDGAGALVVERSTTPGVGLLSLDLHSDGRYSDELSIPAGFRRRPYANSAMLADDEFIPQMNGREVFRHAVSKLPQTVRVACERAGVSLDEVDWFIAHQANDRINKVVRERLGVPAEKVPSNIRNYGNTSAATIPILVDEMRRDGRLRAGQLVCFLALGAGLHWGAAVMRF
jgi:3-oxoacyl-[acyl-carrier-protein] synthase-3